MITTVTTTTTAILMTTAAASLTLIAILALIALLVKKELIGSLQGERAYRVAKSLNVAIVPLMIVFVVTVIVRLSDVLR